MRIHLFFPALLLAVSAVPALSDPGTPPPRKITMRECIETALRNNVDIAITRSGRQSADLGIPMEEAAFLPRFSGNLSFARSIEPTGSALIGTPSLDKRTWRFDAAASELLRSGTTLSLAFENQREEVASDITLLRPEYRTGLTLSARHPLLKNSGREVTEAPLRIARAGSEASGNELLTKAMDIAASSRNAFLAFSAAHLEVEVRKSALALAERLLEQTGARIESGLAAPMDRLPSEASVASRKEEVLRAEAAAQNAADDLKTVLGLRAGGDWEENLIPVFPPGNPDPPGEYDTYPAALRQRPEVAALAARTRQAEIEEAVARNRTWPDLSLTASAGLSGLSGTPYPNPYSPAGGEAFEGDYGDSLDELVSGNYSHWFLGLSTEIPWGLQREKAEWGRARSILEQHRLREEALRAEIRADVRKARRDLESSLARIEASAASVAASAVKLEAEERKLALGATTTTQVLDFQQDLSEARLAEVAAKTDAYRAQTRLWRSVGTILEKEGISFR